MENKPGDLFRRTVLDVYNYVSKIQNMQNAYESPDTLWRIICEMPSSQEQINYRECVKHELICAVHKENLDQIEAKRHEIENIKTKIAQAIQIRKEVGRKKVMAEQLEIESQIKLDLAKKDKARGLEMIAEAATNLAANNETHQNFITNNFI